ncbi:transglutaminase-like cysteine peptidase [Candidatus Enterovibrio altilux]|uniref:Sulfate adenylyltransferase n=1 Tax=Candidatus Enterovibrio altilux TaxID=1927128 RepID=A0A291BAP1_9GAMM|nr:transglutaminase-like cysteine peptidase [Candidatus Enterovibrio luxaltus]ATF10070.1 hypothetical protein BTN50_1629 [Candidatus Enterovibrio luxaltus]
MQKKATLFLLFLLPSIMILALTDTDIKWINKIAAFYGERAGMRMMAWRSMVINASHLSEVEKLTTVNNFFNQLHFVNDINLWGKEDYWATPLEFLGSAAGDCEDFSISKYFTLRELGINDKKLRLIYVKAIKLNQFHMVVGYYPTASSEPVLLDNLNPTIKLASKQRNLLPIYSFNGSRLWLMKERGKGELAGKASRLGLWNDLRARIGRVKLKRPLKNYDE